MSLTLIDSESAGYQYSPEDWSKEQNHLPVRGIVCAQDLQLTIEIQGEEDETSKRSGRVAGRKGFEGVIDLFLVSGADRSVIHVVRKLRARGRGKLGHVGLANGVKVRTKAPN